MDLERIKQLINLVEQSDINGLAVEDGDFRVEIKKTDGQTVSAGTVVSTDQATQTEPVQDAGQPITINAPMSGTFYSASSPEANPFVSVGSVVHKGQPVCVIEAMKTFNEIEADADGTLAEVLVQNGQPVEPGQPLFLLK